MLNLWDEVEHVQNKEQLRWHSRVIRYILVMTIVNKIKRKRIKVYGSLFEHAWWNDEIIRDYKVEEKKTYEYKRRTAGEHIL